MSGVIAPPFAPPVATGYLLGGGGELTLPRVSSFIGGITPTSGIMLATFFVAQRSETIGHVTTVTGSTAAAGLTTAALGIYSADAAGDLTSLLATVSDLTMWAATFTAYSRAWSAPWSKVAGQTYALAVLPVGTTMPNLAGTGISSTFAGLPPVAAMSVAEASLPASVPAGSLAANGNLLAAALQP